LELLIERLEGGVLRNFYSLARGEKLRAVRRWQHVAGQLPLLDGEQYSR